MIPSAENKIETIVMTPKYSGQFDGSVCTKKKPSAMIMFAISTARARLPKMYPNTISPADMGAISIS